MYHLQCTMCYYRMEVASGTKRHADTDKVNILMLVLLNANTVIHYSAL